MIDVGTRKGAFSCLFQIAWNEKWKHQTAESTNWKQQISESTISANLINDTHSDLDNSISK